MKSIREYAEKMLLWKQRPDVFVREVFRIEPDPWQDDALREFPHQNRMSFQASKGVGKSALLSWFIWNFMLTRKYAEVAVTSITSDNLSDGLWKELAKWRGVSAMLKAEFEWTRTRIFNKKELDRPWYASARTWPKSASSDEQADTLAGLHADYMLFVGDEAGGYPDAVMASAEAVLSTGIETKVIIAGNPTHREGPLYRAATSERKLWWRSVINADPDDPQRSTRVSEKWAREQIEKYGRDSPWVLVNVFGQFPPSSDDALIGHEDVEKAMARSPRKELYDWSQKRIGVDVARFGLDSTVIFPRQGLVAFKPTVMRYKDTFDISGRLVQAKEKFGSEVEFIDDTGGWGAGVVDTMISLGHSPVAVNFGGKALNPKYANKRSEMWFEMIEWIKRGGCLPKDDELIKELTAPKFKFDATGRLLLEPKDKIKARIGHSTDKADALALTFAIPDQPGVGSFSDKYHRFSRYKKDLCKADYDPFGEDKLNG